MKEYHRPNHQIKGINNGDSVEQLLQLPHLTVNTAITRCKTEEATRNQITERDHQAVT